MKLGAVVRCYHMTDHLKAVLRSLEYLDTVLLVNHRFRGVPEDIDDTKEIFEVLNQDNIIIRTGFGSLQHDVFNRSLEYFQEEGYDYIFINDADEFISREDRDKMVHFIDNNPYDGGNCVVHDYKDNNTKYATRAHRPTVIVRPHVRFFDTRGASYSNHFFKDITMHHFGFCMKDQAWKKKNLWYRNSSYDEVFKSPEPTVRPDWLIKLMEE